MKDLCFPYDIKPSINTNFGDYIEKWGKHAGIDFSVRPFIGKPLAEQKIRAIWDSEVLVARKANDGSGWYVGLYNSKENATVMYWHIHHTLEVKAGDKIKKGKTIGYAMSSDYSPAHNHIQFNRGKVVKGSWNDDVLNPKQFFDRMEMWSKLNEDPKVIEELKKQVESLKKQVDEQGKKIVTLESGVSTLSKNLLDEKKYRLDAELKVVSLAKKIGYDVKSFDKWTEQEEEIDKKIRLLPHALSIPALIGIIINKLKGK